jgi:hypothetical protein
VRRREVILWGLAGFGLAPGCGFAAGEDCPRIGPAFVQITTGQLDMGERTFDSIRLLEDGRVFRASWDALDRFIGAAGPARVDPQLHARGVEIVAEAGKVRPPSGRPGGPRIVLTAEFAAVSREGGTRHALRHELPDAAGAFVETLRAAAPLGPPPAGPHLWTAPQARDAGAVDIDLSRGPCDGPLARAIAESLETGRVAVSAAGAAESLPEIRNGRRLRYGARYADGHLAFGVISDEP